MSEKQKTPTIVDVLRGWGLIDDKENPTPVGLQVLVGLLTRTPRPPNAPQEVFDALWMFTPGVAMELAIVRLIPPKYIYEMYLLPRNDEYAHQEDALHLPGGIVGAGENDLTATQRIGEREAGITVESIMRQMGFHFSSSESRPTFCSCLVIVKWEGEPKNGEWVKLTRKPPARLIPAHHELWRQLGDLLPDF